jgi:hypothetical protein
VTETESPRRLWTLLDELVALVPVLLVRMSGTAPEMPAAQTGELDLLVMGTRDRGPLRRLAMGSVSSHGVRHAACPVLVVFDPPAPERRPATPARRRGRRRPEAARDSHPRRHAQRVPPRPRRL